MTAWVLGSLFHYGGTTTAEVVSCRVATYNVENYVLADTATRRAKPVQSREQVCLMLRSIQPDVVALQELGGADALADLTQRLRVHGLEYPHTEWVRGYDTNIVVAVISRFPIVQRRPHTNDGFLLQGRRFRTSRGIAEVDIQVKPGVGFTLMAAHLKSKRQVGEADERDLREQEAILLREKIDARLRLDPNARLVILGDFNDTPDSRPIRHLIGRGRWALLDPRPAESNGERSPEAQLRTTPRTVAWTHFYAREDTFSRLDYILLSAAAARWIDARESRIGMLPGWGVASDHRPVLVVLRVDLP